MKLQTIGAVTVAKIRDGNEISTGIIHSTG